MFYKKLKELRKENKISQRTLADMLGITQQAVAKWETGRSTPQARSMASSFPRRGRAGASSETFPAYFITAAGEMQ